MKRIDFTKDPGTGEIFGYDADEIQQALAQGRLDSGHVLYEPPLLNEEELHGKSIAAAWSGIKAERDRRKDGGVKVGAKWFHSDADSRIQHIALNMMGSSVPANLQWKTMDGSFITMTQALASQVFQAVAANDQAIFTVAEQHKAAMEACADPASYDYSGGWPKIYGE